MPAIAFSNNDIALGAWTFERRKHSMAALWAAIS